MKTATITEAKNRLSALIDRVRQGETVVITDRGRPVARLESVVTDPSADPAGRLARLERRGLLRRAGARRRRLQGHFGGGGEGLGCAQPPARGAAVEALRFWDSSAVVPSWSRSLQASVSGGCTRVTRSSLRGVVPKSSASRRSPEWNGRAVCWRLGPPKA